MDPMEQSLLRIPELQPKIPSWAKAEQMERCIPLKDLWHFSPDAAGQKHKLKRNRKGRTH